MPSVTENHPETTSPTPAPIELVNKDEFVKEPYNEKKPINNKEKEKPTQTKEKTIIEETTSTSIIENLTPSEIIPSEVVTKTEITISTMEITTSSVIHEKEPETDLISEEEIEGIGEAIPVLETSMKDIESIMSKIDTSSQSTSSRESTPGLPSVSTTSEISTTSTTTSSGSSTSVINSQPTVTDTANPSGFPYFPYRPRPGIVLDDTDYKPGVHRHRPPIITRPPIGQIGEIFDVTVSAIQGPGGSSGGQNSPGKPFVIPGKLSDIYYST